MKNRSVLSLLILLCSSCFFLVNSSVAQDGSAGQAGEFLRYGVGGRALAMGRAYTALSEDGSAVYWNPAGLAQLDQVYLHFMDTKLFVDSKYMYLAAAKPFYDFPSIGSKITVGLGYVGLRTEGFEYRDEYNRPNSSENFDDEQWALMLPVAFDYISSAGRLAIGVRYTKFQHSIAGYDGGGSGLDIGILAHIINPPRWLLIDRILPIRSIKNLLPLRIGAMLRMPSSETLHKEKQDYPNSLRIGASYSDLLRFIPGKVVMAYEFEKILSQNRENCHILGGEYTLSLIDDVSMAIRTGYHLKGADDGSKSSFGIGLSAGRNFLKNVPVLDRIGIDYCMNRHPEFSSSNTIFLTFRLQMEKENVDVYTDEKAFKDAHTNQLMRTLLKMPVDERLASTNKAVVESTDSKYKDGEAADLETGVAEELMRRAEAQQDVHPAYRYQIGRWDDFIGGLKGIIKEHNNLLKAYRWFVVRLVSGREYRKELEDRKSAWRVHAGNWDNKISKLKKPKNVDALRMYLRTLLLTGDTEKLYAEIDENNGIAKQNPSFTQWDRSYFKALADPNDTDFLKSAIAGTPTIAHGNYVKPYLKLLLGFRAEEIGTLDEVIGTSESKQFGLDRLPVTPLMTDGLLVDDAELIKACILIKNNQGEEKDLFRVMNQYPGTSAFVILSTSLQSLSEGGSVQIVAQSVLDKYRSGLTPSGVVWTDTK